MHQNRVLLSVMLCVLGLTAAPMSVTAGGVGETPAGSVPSAHSTSITSAPDCSTVDYETDGGTKLVETVGHLQCLSEDPDGSYRLVADIDASGTAEWNGGAGFAPIGSFTGTLDGDGHTISGLTISRIGESGVGLFGALRGTVENLRLENVDVDGSNAIGALAGISQDGVVRDVHVVAGGVSTPTGNRAGGLVGSAFDSEITGSHADVAVTGSELAADFGGLVGYANETTISESYANGFVQSQGSKRVGGLVGELRDSEVKRSYATGQVQSTHYTPTAGWAVGGLVGLNNRSSVTDSYATGSVTGIKDVGGLVGEMRGDYATEPRPRETAVVENSYARGGVFEGGDDTRNIGGLVGHVEYGANVTFSYATGTVDPGSSQVASAGQLVGKAGPHGNETDQPYIMHSYTDADQSSFETVGVIETLADSDAGGPPPTYYDGTEPVVSVTGLSTSEMQGAAAASNMDAFAFGGAWGTVTDPDDYPTLLAAVEGSQRSLPYFQVSNARIEALGDTSVTVSAELDNTGGGDDSQTVDLRVDTDDSGTLEADESIANRTVDLDADRYDAIEFSEVSTGDLPAGTYTYGVVSENDSATGELRIEQLGTLNVAVRPQTVPAGEQSEVTVSVRGQQPGDSGDSPLRSASVEIPALGVEGETDGVGSADLQVSPDQSGDYDVQISVSGYEDATATLTVEGDSGTGTGSGGQAASGGQTQAGGQQSGGQSPSGGQSGTTSPGANGPGFGLLLALAAIGAFLAVRLRHH
jgi:hypothetical protein